MVSFVSTLLYLTSTHQIYWFLWYIKFPFFYFPLKIPSYAINPFLLGLLCMCGSFFVWIFFFILSFFFYTRHSSCGDTFCKDCIMILILVINTHIALDEVVNSLIKNSSEWCLQCLAYLLMFLCCKGDFKSLKLLCL